jgi:hypothetical protein
MQAPEAITLLWKQDSKYILERGIKRGELHKDLNIELSIDLIFAPLFYRLLITGENVDSTFVEQMIGYAFAGLDFKN